MNKKGIEFAWIFAIIIGSLILFLAFYFISSQLFLKEKAETGEKAHSLDILLNPFSFLGAIGAVTAKSIELGRAVNLTFECYYEENFGKNVIIIDSGIPRSVYDKYIFAEDFKEKKIQVISKPLKMPWRIADLVYVFPSRTEYCFINFPTKLREELRMLNVSNIKLSDNIRNCKEDSIKVCFELENEKCNVTISGEEIKKNRETMYFAGNDALMLAAIFSKNKNYYNCNLKRIFARLKTQVEVYKEKQRKMRCRSYVNLENLINAIPENINRNTMNVMKNAAMQIENQNSHECPLF
ncbi:MAG: hypothetical protein NZ889_01540 [Candidatus Pacearchaeota archaeon]|nr:hypothetical protein [Candidatus Pacearchaeota archaeon]